MKSGWLATQINRTEVFANKLSLFSERGSGEVPINGNKLGDWSYEYFWQEAIKHYWFDLKLLDESFFIFQENTPKRGDFRFAFYECPYHPKLSFDDYCKSSDDDSSELVEYLEAEYELLAIQKKETVTPIRYEYCEKDFTPSLHPVSHIHFGSNSEVRVGSFHVLTPVAFFLFVIRQCYPKTWDFHVVKNDGMLGEARAAFSEMEFLKEEFLGEQLHLDFYLKNGPTIGSTRPREARRR